MPQPGSSLNMITGREMSESAGPQGPICHPSRSCAFPYPYLFPRSCVWFSTHGPHGLSAEWCPRRMGDLVPDKVPSLLPSLPCLRHVPEAAGSSLPAGKVHLTPTLDKVHVAPVAPWPPNCRQSPSRACPHGPPCAQLSPQGSQPVPWLMGQGLCSASVPGVCQHVMLGVEGQTLPQCWWGCLSALVVQTMGAASWAAGQLACAMTIPIAPTRGDCGLLALSPLEPQLSHIPQSG